MIKLRIKAWLVILLIWNLPIYAQEKISFFEEHIDFELDSIYFSINGIYSFYNPMNKGVNQRIIFPFGVEIDQIDSISIINLNDLNQIQFQSLKKSIVFNINILPNDTIDVNIFYNQRFAERNTYIISSTRSWKQPLKKAIYTLTTSLPVNEKEFPYPFLSKEIINDKTLYRWEETNFVPDREFEIVVE
jgi:hypothetical protein